MTVKPFQIGTFIVDPPLLSAPMAGFTNLAYRTLLRQLGGVGLIATEMVSAKSFVYKEAKGEEVPERLWGIRDEQRPLAVQIWDNTPDTLAYFAQILTRDYKPSVIDLNFGCPAPAIAQKSTSGSYLLRTPEKMGRIIEQVVKAASPIPVTAKIRLGWTRDTVNAIDVAQVIEDAGASAMTVHGRTAQDLYRGTANWEAIATIKPHLRKIPLIGNGDIKSAEQATEYFRRYPVDGIMIGRAGLVQPWLFRQIADMINGRVVFREPSLEQQRNLLLQHFTLLIDHVGVDKAVILMRKFAPCYVKGKRGARLFRTAICSASTEAGFRDIISTLFPVSSDIPEAG